MTHKYKVHGWALERQQAIEGKIAQETILRCQFVYPSGFRCPAPTENNVWCRKHRPLPSIGR